MSSSGVFVIGALIGYILYGAIIHIGKVEEDYNKMAELKVQAESADIAKSQVPNIVDCLLLQAQILAHSLILLFVLCSF